MTRSPIPFPAGAAPAPAPSTIAAVTIWKWNSATPYLLGSIILVMALIAAAMLMLVCSIRREDRQSTVAMSGEKSVKEADVSGLSVPLPEFVVIMAGDENPTFLALPAVLPEAKLAAGKVELVDSFAGR